MLMLSAPQTGFAYGAEAHRVAGFIADQLLCTGARDAIAELAPEYSLAEAGNWADRIRSDPGWDHARPWHYINIPDGVNLADAQRRSSGDVLVAIERFRAELADQSLSAQQRKLAYLFLVHFVADVHQPLHVGRRGDRGGNKVDVSVDGRGTSLHSYWDTRVLDGRLKSPAGMAGRLVAANEGAVTGWQQDEPAVWVVESQALRPEVYDFGSPDAGGRVALDSAYRLRALEITEYRLAQAGIRLAGVLNAIWCPANPAH